MEGEGQLDPGRGPWSQIVFDEIKTKEEITHAGWEGLLEHCRGLEQAVPGTTWKKRSRQLIAVLVVGIGVAGFAYYQHKQNTLLEVNVGQHGVTIQKN